MVSPTPNKGYTYPAHGGAVNAWDTPLNTDFDYIDLNVGGYYPITISSTVGAGTVTFLSSGAWASPTAANITLPASLAQNMNYVVTGTMTQSQNLVYPAAGGFFYVTNGTSGSFSLITKTAGAGTTYTVRQGGTSVCVSDAANIRTDSNKPDIPVTYANMQTVSATRLLGNASTSATIPTEIAVSRNLSLASSAGLLGPLYTTPNVQIFTTTGAGTWTRPSDASGNPPIYIRVRMVAAGGGGGAAITNSGTAGGQTTFAGGTWTTGGGGGGGPTASGTQGAAGTGGANGTGTVITRIIGGRGGAGPPAGGGAGGDGADAPFFTGGGKGVNAGTGLAGAANTGGGGAGGGDNGSGRGQGGGSGEYVEFIITTPAASYSLSVGTGGTGGPAGGRAGGNGADGRVEVVSYWQ